MQRLLCQGASWGVKFNQNVWEVAYQCDIQPGKRGDTFALRRLSVAGRSVCPTIVKKFRYGSPIFWGLLPHFTTIPLTWLIHRIPSIIFQKWEVHSVLYTGLGFKNLYESLATLTGSNFVLMISKLISASYEPEPPGAGPWLRPAGFGISFQLDCSGSHLRASSTPLDNHIAWHKKYDFRRQ